MENSKVSKKRKVLTQGKDLTLYIPNDVSQECLNWLNSQVNLWRSIEKLIQKETYLNSIKNELKDTLLDIFAENSFDFKPTNKPFVESKITRRNFLKTL